MARKAIARMGTVLIITVTGLALAAFAQRGGTTQQPTSPTGPPANTPTAPNVPSRPTQPNTQQQPQQQMEMERPIFLSGKVVMDDGTPPPESVVIERVCGGNPRP